jgi:hypothetical protein
MMSASRYERPGQVRAVAAVLLLAGSAMLSGCSSTIDHIPTAAGGLPQGVPQRPATPAAYPAVHDMPPTRADEPLSDAEKKRLREELAKMCDTAARDATTAISADPTGATVGATRNP